MGGEGVITIQFNSIKGWGAYLGCAIGARGTGESTVARRPLGTVIIEGADGGGDGVAVSAVLSVRAHQASGDTGLAGGCAVGASGAPGEGGTAGGAVPPLTAGDEGEGGGGGASGGAEVAWGRGKGGEG